MLIFDHLKLVLRDNREMQRFRSVLMGAGIGVVQEFSIEHESDNSCCRKEPWNDTLAYITKAVKPPAPIVAFNLDRLPDEDN